MAILHRKEEKIQVVLGRLPKKYTQEEFLEMFIKLYSKDWGKIKSAYVKQSQDKEPDTVVNMPKPELYLKQLLDTYLANKPAEAAKEEPAKVIETAVVKPKTAAKKKATTNEAELAKTPKAVSKKKVILGQQPEPTKEEVKKKSPAKKKTEIEAVPVKAKKTKATAK